MQFIIDPHTIKRAAERGASEAEIIDVLTTGFQIDAKYNRSAKGKMFDYFQRGIRLLLIFCPFPCTPLLFPSSLPAFQLSNFFSVLCTCFAVLRSFCLLTSVLKTSNLSLRTSNFSISPRRAGESRGPYLSITSWIPGQARDDKERGFFSVDIDLT